MRRRILEICTVVVWGSSECSRIKNATTMFYTEWKSFSKITPGKQVYSSCLFILLKSIKSCWIFLLSHLPQHSQCTASRSGKHTYHKQNPWYKMYIFFLLKPAVCIFRWRKSGFQVFLLNGAHVVVFKKSEWNNEYSHATNLRSCMRKKVRKNQVKPWSKRVKFAFSLSVLFFPERGNMK